MDQLGSYALRRSLGDTPVGALHEAIDRSAGRPALLEVVRDDLVRASSVREACLTEARRLAGLTIEGLASVLAPLDAQGKVGLACRLPEGRSLRAVVDDIGRLPWEPAGHLLVAVARVLARLAAASPPVALLDLRPERIWLDTEGKVTLVPAAGGALLADSTIGAARSAPLLRYASPELLDGSTPGSAADLYALGLILYELLAGAPPFQSSAVRTVIHMHCVEAPPPLPDAVRAATPRALLALVDELLRKRPAERPTASDLCARAAELLPERSRELLAELARPPASHSSRAPIDPVEAESAAASAPTHAPAEEPSELDEPAANDDERPAASGATRAVDRQLTPAQIVALVLGATVLAILLAYCASSGEGEGGSTNGTATPTRPIAPDPMEPERRGTPQPRPLAPDEPSSALPLQPFGPAFETRPDSSSAPRPSPR